VVHDPSHHFFALFSIFLGSLLYIINIIKNEILKGMSHSQPKKIEKRGEKIGDPALDPQHYLI
jgi:hypothetical protein